MKRIVEVTGRGFYLRGNDIDTDRIIPARYLKCVTFEGLGDHVFEDDRIQLKGEHPFDRKENKGCSILLVDENFGSGSSREHAVPALTQWGIQAIIGLSFAAIFRGNAVGNGLVCVTVTPEIHEFITRVKLNGWESDFSINLESMEIEFNDQLTKHVPCKIPDSHREKLTTGTWDDLATAAEAGNLIEATAETLPYFGHPA